MGSDFVTAFAKPRQKDISLTHRLICASNYDFMKQVLNATGPVWEHSELALQCVNNYTGYKAVESLALYYFGSILKLSLNVS